MDRNNLVHWGRKMHLASGLHRVGKPTSGWRWEAVLSLSAVYRNLLRKQAEI